MLTTLRGLFFGCLIIVAVEADVRMPFSKLPAAVQRAARQQTRGAEIVGASSEKEAGRMTYEVQTRLNNKTRDLTFDEAGKLLEVEQEVSLESLPPAARTALERSSASGRIRKVESVIAGTSISYEADLVTDTGKHKEIAVNPDGTPHRE